MRQLPDQFIQLKGVRVKREFCGNVEAEGDIAPRRQLHLLPGEIADIGFSAGRWSDVMQQKFQPLPLEFQGDLPVIDASAAVAKYQASNPQMKQCLAPEMARSLHFRRREIAVSHLVESQRHLWAIDQQIIQRKLLAPERKNAICKSRRAA